MKWVQNIGCNILSSEMNRSIDCRNMLTPSARRKTPLKNAPRSRERCQPKGRSERESFFADIWFQIRVRDELWRSEGLARTFKAVNATMKPIKSFSFQQISYEGLHNHGGDVLHSEMHLPREQETWCRIQLEKQSATNMSWGSVGWGPIPDISATKKQKEMDMTSCKRWDWAKCIVMYEGNNKWILSQMENDECTEIAEMWRARSKVCSHSSAP